LFGGLTIPRCSSNIVLRHGAAEVVHYSKVELGSRIALIGALSIPIHWFGTVLLRASALVVHGAEAELGDRVSLIGGFAIPLYRFGFILGDTQPLGVYETEVKLGSDVSLSVPISLGSIVLRHPLARRVHSPECVLGASVALAGGLAMPLSSFGVVLLHAVAIGVVEPQHPLSFGVSLVSPFTVPLQCLHIIVVCPIELEAVKHAEKKWGTGGAVVGGSAIPFDRLRVALRHAVAGAVHVSDVELSQPWAGVGTAWSTLPETGMAVSPSAQMRRQLHRGNDRGARPPPEWLKAADIIGVKVLA
jgi:hypothetical protein